MKVNAATRFATCSLIPTNAERDPPRMEANLCQLFRETDVV